MKSSKSLVYGTVAFLLVVASFIVSWKMILPNYKENQQQIAQVDEEIKQSKTKLESLKTAESSINELGDLVNDMLVAIPEGKDTPNLITELEALAKKHNTVIPSIQITDSSSTKNSTSSASASSMSENVVGISFAVSGTFDDLSSFITSIEKDIRFMNITNLSLSMSEDEMTLALQINAYKRIDTSLSSDSMTSASQTSAAATGSGT